jgi:hypothetical protein
MFTLFGGIEIIQGFRTSSYLMSGGKFDQQNFSNKGWKSSFKRSYLPLCLNLWKGFLGDSLMGPTKDTHPGVVQEKSCSFPSLTTS